MGKVRTTPWLNPRKFVDPWGAALGYLIAYTICLVRGHKDDGTTDGPYIICAACGFDISIMGK